MVWFPTDVSFSLGHSALQELIRQLGHYDGVAIVKLNLNFIIR